MKKSSKCYLSWLIIPLVSLSMLGGCVKKPDTKSHGKQNKHSLTLSIVQDPSSLNPHELALGIRGLIVGKWIFEGLTRLNLEGKYELAGAKKVDIDPSQKCYTFTLRNHHYSDGSRVSAYDYARSWKEAISPNSPCTKAHFFYCIKNAEKAKKKMTSLDTVGIKALDDNTLFVELEHPAPYFLRLLASPLFAPFKMKEGAVLVNGPYVVDEWKKGNYMKLKTNPFFWDEAHLSIKNVMIHVIENSMTALSLYDQGEIDWIGGPFNWLSSDLLTKGISDGRFFKEDKVIYLPFWLRLNTEYFPLSSTYIRRALSCVINRDEIVEHILQGDEPLFTPFPAASFLDQSILADNNFKKGNLLFEKGLKELDLTRETFPPLKISVLGITTVHKKLAEYLQERWRMALGIKVDLDVQELAAFYSGLSTGNYQIGGHFISTEHNDPASYLELLHTSSNFSSWESSDYTEIIHAMRNEKDPSIREDLIKKAEEILHREIPVIWIANRSQYHAYRSDLKNLCFDHIGIPDLRWAHIE